MEEVSLNAVIGRQRLEGDESIIEEKVLKHFFLLNNVYSGVKTTHCVNL